MIDSQPDLLFQILVRDSQLSSQWYSTVQSAEVSVASIFSPQHRNCSVHSSLVSLCLAFAFQRLERVTDRLEVWHVLMRPLSGGVVSSRFEMSHTDCAIHNIKRSQFLKFRDYINLVYWKQLANGSYVSSVSAMTHPDRPETKKVVR